MTLRNPLRGLEMLAARAGSAMVAITMDKSRSFDMKAKTQC
jgi:hypothetical protein